MRATATRPHLMTYTWQEGWKKKKDLFCGETLHEKKKKKKTKDRTGHFTTICKQIKVLYDTEIKPYEYGTPPPKKNTGPTYKYQLHLTTKTGHPPTHMRLLWLVKHIDFQLLHTTHRANSTQIASTWKLPLVVHGVIYTLLFGYLLHPALQQSIPYQTYLRRVYARGVPSLREPPA